MYMHTYVKIHYIHIYLSWRKTEEDTPYDLLKGNLGGGNLVDGDPDVCEEGKKEKGKKMGQ